MRRKIQLRLEALPRDYEPGYPARLDTATLRDLTAPRRRARFAAIILACGLGVAPVQDGTRKAKVEKALRENREGKDRFDWWGRTDLLRADGGGFVPRVPVMFGNSYTGVFDVARARRMAMDLFAAYGYELRAKVDIEIGEVKARLDGADPERKIGFELMGVGKGGGSFFSQGVSEEADEIRLDDDERRALGEAGWTLLAMPQTSYNVLDGEHKPAMLAWAFSLVDFLNTTTDGEDVRVSDLMGRKLVERSFAVDPASLPAADLKDEGDVLVFELTAETKIGLDFPAAAFPLHEQTRRDEAGKASKVETTEAYPVSFLELGLEGPAASGRLPAFKLIQKSEEAETAIAEDSRSPLIMVPREFRADRSFRVVMELGPGKYRLSKRAVVTGVRGTRMF